MGITEHTQRHRLIRVVAGLGAAAVLVVFVLSFAKMRICDEQLSDQGYLVPVCRHLLLSDPPVTVFGIVLLGLIMIAFPVAEVSMFGFSLKQRITEATAAAKAAEEAAGSAEKAAEQAKRTSSLADKVSRTAQNAAEDAAKTAKAAKDAAQSAEQGSQLLEQILLAWDRPQSRQRSDVREVLASLVDEYNNVRAEDPQSSWARTARLTSIIAKMIAELSESGADAMDVKAALATLDLGKRVAAYSYFYGNPDPDKMQLLVDAVVNEPNGHRFGQYWGLRAVRRQVLADPSALDENSRGQLERLLRSIGQATDRAYEIREILKLAPGKNA